MRNLSGSLDKSKTCWYPWDHNDILISPAATALKSVYLYCESNVLDINIKHVLIGRFHTHADTKLLNDRVSLLWRNNGRGSVSNHQPLYRLFRRRPKKTDIKAPRHWLLCREFTGDRWILRTNASNAENVSIWWRYHVGRCLFKRLGHQ